MASFKQMIKGILRLPANALVASSDALPGRVEECLQNSPALQAAIDERLAGQACPNGNPAAEKTVDEELEALDSFTREGTGPYPYYKAEADKLGLDINDYLEKNMGWGDMTPVLERMILPYMRGESSVCELGPGTGRWSRRILEHITTGQLHLVDYSPWFVQMLAEYFSWNPRVQVHQTDGFSLPIEENESLDLIVSFATFVMLKPGVILCYARDFLRALKPGGHFVIEYLDINSPEGWEWLQTYSQPENATVFVYQTPEVMARFFSSVGFEILRDERVAEWFTEYPYKMLVGRKPLTPAPTSA